MFQPLFYYQVRINFQVAKNNVTGIEELEIFEKTFSGNAPIINRNDALRFYESYIEELVEKIGEQYIDFETATKQLEKLYCDITKCLGVFMIINEAIEHEELDIRWKLNKMLGLPNGLMIHGMPCDAQRILWNLQEELDYYNHYQLDKGGLETSTLFYDEEEDDTCSYSFLKTPFEWKEFQIPPDNLSKDFIDEISSYIENGECQTIEFKPCLVYNFNTGKSGISIKEKIAKTICAFLNSKYDSILLIGVRDDKTIQGLDYDFKLSNKPDPKDFFRLEFSELLQRFFEHSIRNFITNGFVCIEEEWIFVVTVKPSTRPIFMKNSFKNSDGKWVEDFQFYYRSESSSMQIKDVREIVQYCLDRFGSI